MGGDGSDAGTEVQHVVAEVRLDHVSDPAQIVGRVLGKDVEAVVVGAISGGRLKGLWVGIAGRGRCLRAPRADGREVQGAEG